MPRSLIHCSKGSTDHHRVIDDAVSNGLNAVIRYPFNPYAVDIVNDDSDTAKHNQFLQRYEHDPNFTILYHADHEQCRQGVFKSIHGRVASEQAPVSTPSVPVVEHQ